MSIQGKARLGGKCISIKLLSKEASLGVTLEHLERSDRPLKLQLRADQALIWLDCNLYIA